MTFRLSSSPTTSAGWIALKTCCCLAPVVCTKQTWRLGSAA
jgi:hypothetical protein